MTLNVLALTENCAKLMFSLMLDPLDQMKFT